VGNALLAIVFSVAVLKIGIDMVAGMIPAQAEVGGTILRAIFASLFADYIRLEFVMSGVLLVIGITLLITALILKKRQAGSSSQPTLTDPKAKNQTEIEVETEKLVDIPNTSKKTSKESKDTT